MKLWRITLLLFCLLAMPQVKAQLVNAYAKVTSVSGGGTVLNLGTMEETYDTFEDGEFVIIMQMQGATITGGTGAGFGTITDIESAGLFEIGTILTHTASSITLTAPLSNTYEPIAGSVQVVSYPTMGGGGNYTTTSNLRARKWSGEIGGVIAFNVSGNLYLAHEISADSMGFDWGAKAGTAASTECWYSTYYVKEDGNIHAAYKGGGLQNPLSTQMCGRAPIANGGGGGVGHNGGGGGGGNFTGGGDGDPGTCSALFGGAGAGGHALNSWIPADTIYRIFLGGGGGGGHENNGKGSHGGYGGGIIIIEADSIFADCAGSVKISANASEAPSKKNDGQGGGGAGGSIILYTEYIGATAGCPLSVSADGGDGGDVNHDDDHGGGGGGGQGFIYVEAEEMDLMPMDYLTFSTANGEGGLNCYTCGAADDGEGVDDSGIFFGEAPLLPVGFVYVNAQLLSEQLVSLSWTSGDEFSCERYDIYRSYDGNQWQVIGSVPCVGYGAGSSDYVFVDDQPLKFYNYYIIKQYNSTGRSRNSNMVSVFLDAATNGQLNLYPNPSDGQMVQLHSIHELSGGKLLITDLQGRHVSAEAEMTGPYDLVITTTGLLPGIYLITLQTARGLISNARMIIE